MPVEPPPTPWRFPDLDDVDDSGLVGVGADNEPGTILAAYRAGMFPMPVEEDELMGWWSPDPRGVLRLNQLKVSRSLRRSVREFDIRVNHAFPTVLDACADPGRPHGWIDSQIHNAYLALHDMGWVHSVEAWQDDRLVGGLYGVALGGLFAGESMFHRVRDASKAALVALVGAFDDGVDRLIDVQWQTDHLESLGVQELGRAEYLAGLPHLLAQPASAVFSGGERTIPRA
ncbi:MAG: leucyl/phenylalanyl-tRNA--protein transferase [Acidimicrobiales bacterium]|nr:leucyl/phenylalanyl-tRNA--protein transferase [Acidimicrobiales bacterium]